MHNSYFKKTSYRALILFYLIIRVINIRITKTTTSFLSFC